MKVISINNYSKLACSFVKFSFISQNLKHTILKTTDQSSRTFKKLCNFDDKVTIRMAYLFKVRISPVQLRAKHRQTKRLWQICVDISLVLSSIRYALKLNSYYNHSQRENDDCRIRHHFVYHDTHELVLPPQTQALQKTAFPKLNKQYNGNFVVGMRYKHTV